jgi:glycosyltransferase involved in cell wall biosynthesis
MASATIVIPCYNEENRINVSAFRNYITPSHDIRFLFVDDGSTDGTAQLLENLHSFDSRKFVVLRLPQNCGKAEAVRQGILAAADFGSNYVGFWDADLATPLSAIPQFIDLAEGRPEFQIVMGARVKLLGRVIERRGSRHYVGRIFATAVSTLLDLNVYDTQCGAKLFRTSLSLHELFHEPFLSRWIFDVEIIARLIQTRRPTLLPPAKDIIYEFPLTEWRDVAGSKLQYGDFCRAAWELGRIYFRYFSARNPRHHKGLSPT